MLQKTSFICMIFLSFWIDSSETHFLSSASFMCWSNLLYPGAIFWCDINQDLSHHKLNCSISNQQISSNYQELLALCFCVSIVSRFYEATLLTRQIRNKLIYIHPGGPLETFHLNNLNIQKSRMLLLTELIQTLALYPPCQDWNNKCFYFPLGKYLPLFEV